MTIGGKLQYLRRNVLKLNQQDFAEEVTKVTKVKGFYQELVSKYETGKDAIKEHHLEAIAVFYSKERENELTKSDLIHLSTEALIAKMENKKPLVLETPIQASKQKKSATKRNYFIYAGLTLLLLFVIFIIYSSLQKDPPIPIVDISYPHNDQTIKRNNIPVEGTIIGPKKGYRLWLFIEKQDSVMNTYFWPKSEIEHFQQINSSDTLKWFREIYHFPSPSDDLRYKKQFSISLFAIPEYKVDFIESWFMECKKTKHYPPLNANRIIEYRQKMVSGLSLISQ